MEIKDFVKTTLKQLSEALDESTKELKTRIKLINTILRTTGHDDYGLIEFDLAVEAKTSESTGKGAGVKIAIVEAKLGKDIEQTSNSISRIRFKLEANL